jgi:hypothetical protein
MQTGDVRIVAAGKIFPAPQSKLVLRRDNAISGSSRAGVRWRHLVTAMIVRSRAAL